MKAAATRMLKSALVFCMTLEYFSFELKLVKAQYLVCCQNRTRVDLLFCFFLDIITDSDFTFTKATVYHFVFLLKLHFKLKKKKWEYDLYKKMNTPFSGLKGLEYSKIQTAVPSLNFCQ